MRAMPASDWPAGFVLYSPTQAQAQPSPLQADRAGRTGPTLACVGAGRPPTPPPRAGRARPQLTEKMAYGTVEDVPATPPASARPPAAERPRPSRLVLGLMGSAMAVAVSVYCLLPIWLPRSLRACSFA